jgi:DNA-binding MarR family transcriptional regulator
MTDDPVVFRDLREGNLLRELIRISRLMSDETVAMLRSRGVDGMMPAYPRLLGNLDTEGTRIGALARKMGVTRQAAAQLAVEIERVGFVERVPDPQDGRGVIIRFTPRGRATLAIAVEVIAEIEADYARIVGADRLALVKATLAELLAARDPDGAFGLD